VHKSIVRSVVKKSMCNDRIIALELKQNQYFDSANAYVNIGV
jgi:hypothetical protein